MGVAPAEPGPREAPSPNQRRHGPTLGVAAGSGPSAAGRARPPRPRPGRARGAEERPPGGPGRHPPRPVSGPRGGPAPRRARRLAGSPSPVVPQASPQLEPARAGGPTSGRKSTTRLTFGDFCSKFGRLLKPHSAIFK